MAVRPGQPRAAVPDFTVPNGAAATNCPYRSFFYPELRLRRFGARFDTWGPTTPCSWCAQSPKEKEGIMRRMLFAVAALLVCGTAWADGSIIRWDQIVGNRGHESDANLVVGAYAPSPRWYTVGSGRAMFNLGTGFFSIHLGGASTAWHGPNVLGNSVSVMAIATVVCDSRGDPVEATTKPFAIDEGKASYTEFLSVPDSCGLNPQETVLLVRFQRAVGDFPFYHLYGADRHIQ